MRNCPQRWLKFRRAALFGVAVSIGSQACQAEGQRALVSAPLADTIQCASVEDRSGDGLAAGLLVRFSIQVGAAGPYHVYGQVFQDRRRGAVSYANERGVDMSRLALADAHWTRVYANKPGAVPVTLWFPGSELRVRGRRGEAWVDVQVSDTTSTASKGATTSRTTAQRFYRCRLGRIDPASFVARLPGQDAVPPLPEASGR